MKAEEPGADEAHVVIERQPARAHVVGADLHRRGDGPDVGEQVVVGQQHALGGPCSPTCMDEGGVGACPFRSPSRTPYRRQGLGGRPRTQRGHGRLQHARHRGGAGHGDHARAHRRPPDRRLAGATPRAVSRTGGISGPAPPPAIRIPWERAEEIRPVGSIKATVSPAAHAALLESTRHRRESPSAGRRSGDLGPVLLAHVDVGKVGLDCARCHSAPCTVWRRRASGVAAGGAGSGPREGTRPPLAARVADAGQLRGVSRLQGAASSSERPNAAPTDSIPRAPGCQPPRPRSRDDCASRVRSARARAQLRGQGAHHLEDAVLDVPSPRAGTGGASLRP